MSNEIETVMTAIVHKSQGNNNGKVQQGIAQGGASNRPYCRITSSIRTCPLSIQPRVHFHSDLFSNDMRSSTRSKQLGSSHNTPQ